MSLLDLLADLLAGGRRRRLQKAVARLRVNFEESSLTGAALQECARAYRRAMRLALRIDPSQAIALFRSYDARIHAEHYALAFHPSDEAWLARLIRRDERDTLAIVLELTYRLRLEKLNRDAAARLAAVLGRRGDADRLVAHLLRCRQMEVLTADMLRCSLRDHLALTPLERDGPLWTPFFASLPEELLPPLFEVHHFLGRGADAVRLADTPARRQAALACCARATRLEDVRAGLELAERLGEVGARRELRERAGDLLVAAGRDEEAIDEFHAADCPGKVSECNERLGRPFEALVSCPAAQGERLARLAGACQPLIDRLVEQGKFPSAARQARGLLTHLGRAAEVTPAVAQRQAEAAALRDGILAAGRRHFSQQAQHAADARVAYEEWSRFEEEAGEWTRAAQRAEDAGDRYRAHRLYRQAGRFGDAVRVLEVDVTPRGLLARAEARAEGGDPAGAARLYDEAGQPEKAIQLFQQAGEYAAAARCLRRHRGDAAIEFPELESCLKRAGSAVELAELCVQAIRTKGRGTRAVEVLRRLLDEDGTLLPPSAVAAARSALDELGTQGRRAFEERVQGWVARARAEIEGRYAGVWGFDLGTTTCSAAVYDTRAGQAVLCPWKNRNQFASTLSLDEAGNELVGLTGEEIFARGVVGHISSAKRKMGTTTVYKVRERTYRPEEVAARLIRHARSIVEGYLAARVRERVAELSAAEFGEAPPEDWLNWAERHHDLRLSRPRVVITIPAYFTNNQKHATRDAGAIAGVEVVRLLHEPTAACLFASRSRRLTGRIVVVDLGAGTLDVCALDVGDNVYDVQQVLGDTHYGGNDFDAAISQTLAERLRQSEGVEVPATGLPRKRLEVAAECLKVELSSQEHACFLLRAFAESRDVKLELSRSELEAMLAGPLENLSRICKRFRDELRVRPNHLVLVGGPMLSPLVSRRVEDVFSLKRTAIEDPRTAVACGAALQAAVLDGKLRDSLLMDVTPLPLGIRAFDNQDREHFSKLIDRNEHIPLDRKQIYSTRKDDQPDVHVEVFQGDLTPEARIGHFQLEGIRPAKKGEPQIEVTFSIDASCVLQVTARDQKTGLSNSIRITDTTLLSPGERETMVRRFREEQEQEERRRQVVQLLEDLGRQVEDATGSDSASLMEEWRSRMTAYRPSAVQPDAETQAALFEMFNKANELESELILAEVPLRDLASKSREYCQRTGELAAGPRPGEALRAAVHEGEHLANALRRHLDRVRPLRARLASWNAVLVSLATSETDPIRRFLACHAARDYARALDALACLATPPDHLPHVRRHLDCLARVGDASGYRRILTAHAEQLHATPIDRSRPEIFLARARPSLAQVRLTSPDGGAVGNGFLISDRLVAINQRWLNRETNAAQVEVRIAGRTHRVDRIFSATSPYAGVALLRLVEPAEGWPFRLGYAGLARIGDPVWVFGAESGGTEPSAALTSGVIDKFESFPELNLRLLKMGIQLPRGGGPVFDDLGEVIGILTLRDRPADMVGEDAAYAFGVDVLDSLLAPAGFSKWPE